MIILELFVLIIPLTGLILLILYKIFNMTNEKTEEIKETEKIEEATTESINDILKIKLIEDGKKPFQKHSTDACYDLYAREITHEPNYIRYKLGIATEIPEDYCALVFPRSSSSKKNLILANCVGVIDSDYRGEWEARFKLTFPNLIWYKLNNKEWDESTFNIYEVGDRVCQFMLVRKTDLPKKFVKSLNETKRGKGGFGSTGA